MQNNFLRLLYQQHAFPVFQNRMYETEKEAINCPKGNIQLVEDLRTGLVYNAEFNPKLMVYDECYQNEQAVSQVFQKHLTNVAHIVYRLLGKSSLVEVGCGKAFFLELLQSQGFDVAGFDPTYEGKNKSVERAFFNKEAKIKAKGIILRHVLEHVQNPANFIQSLSEANNNNGRVYIEVPCFDWIIKNHAWFDIFYEHVNYFRLSDFDAIFDNVIESGKLFGDQYIYVVAELSSIKKPVLDINHKIPSEIKIGYDHSELQLNLTGPIVIWGGASKGVIFALLRSKMGYAVDMVIDINPAKQNKYLPASNLMVHSPEDAMTILPEGTKILVMNSNYIEEIIEMSENKYTYIGIDHE